uniref:Uncharacterized protein n=1 Tax=Oryza rufipogon TaxID=4529 RepID=A0A0E0MWB6_ORYRU
MTRVKCFMSFFEEWEVRKINRGNIKYTSSCFATLSSSPMASSNSWMNAPPPPPTPSTLSLSPHTTASSTLHVALVVVLCVAALAGALLFSIVLHIVYTKWLKPRIFARAAPPPPSQEVVVQMPPFSRGLASVKKLIGR